MNEEFRLPDLGEGLTEAELVQWHVAVGDAVALNQTLAEVETAKAVVELPSPFAGVVRALHVEPGAHIDVGASLVSIDTAAGHTAAGTEPDAPDTREANLVGYGAAPSVPGHPTRRRRRVPPVTSTAAPEEPPGHGMPRAAGAEERVGEEPGPEPTQEPGRTTRIPIRGVREQMAAAMVASAFTAPHASAWVTIDVTRAVRLLRELRDEIPVGAHHIGPLVLTAKAVCLALARTPSLNARWDAAAGEVIEQHFVNLGIAAATERGLIVPNIKDADRMTLPELRDALAELTETARAGRSHPAALRGGTFTITNIGALGMEGGTPILNPGEAGILAMGAVLRRPWEHRGKIALRDVMTLTLAFDHRLVDGAQAAAFLRDVGDVLREPGRALLLG